MEQKYAEILGVKITSTSTSSVLKAISKKLSAKKKFFIVTPNPEIIMLAQKDSELLKILNSADFSLPDGIGLKLAEKNLKIIKGRDLMLDLIARNSKVFLLGASYDVNKKAIETLSKRFPAVKFRGVSGPLLNNSGKPINKKERQIEAETEKKINQFKPNMLFVGFGAPKQEKWVYKWLPKLDVGGAMVVGGAFDYISGEAKLPPRWIANLGFEWLWRLITQPKRFKRILTATFLFPLKIIQSKIMFYCPFLRLEQT
ncbi:WecB/TagA/CpsF family glycosyltransferase [Candidatus Woesebacteria bacterium]|nr:WecB/TagA/CpsF family glycosyltransferase [Candidatus Woesebacteria bacterium]